MSVIPPAMWENPEAYEPREDQAEEHMPEDGSKHRHGPGCGHEAIEHGDHTDYVHEGRRHFWNRDHWEHH